jgi:hypothetical protein
MKPLGKDEPEALHLPEEPSGVVDKEVAKPMDSEGTEKPVRIQKHTAQTEVLKYVGTQAEPLQLVEGKVLKFTVSEQMQVDKPQIELQPGTIPLESHQNITDNTDLEAPQTEKVLLESLLHTPTTIHLIPDLSLFLFKVADACKIRLFPRVNFNASARDSVSNEKHNTYCNRKTDFKLQHGMVSASKCMPKQAHGPLFSSIRSNVLVLITQMQHYLIKHG